MNKLNLLGLVIAVLCVTSCSGSDGSLSNSTNNINGNPYPTNSEFGAVAGLWLVTSWGGNDTVVFHSVEILATGWLTSYNYSDCYTSDTVRIRALGVSRFQVIDDGQIDPENTFTITTSSVGNVENAQFTFGQFQFTATRVSALNPAFVTCTGSTYENTLTYNADGTVSIVPMWVPIKPAKPPGQQPIGVNDNPTSANEDWSSNTSKFAGFWHGTTLRNGQLDENYLLISANGELTFADYQGDAVGNGLNCYVINTVFVETDGNDRFRVYINGQYEIATISIVDDTLTLAIDSEILTFRRTNNPDTELMECL